MNLAKRIKELLDGERVATLHDLDGFPDTEICTPGDLKHLVATLRKCETAIDSLPMNVPMVINGATNWNGRDELLREIREVLDGNRN